MKNILFITVCVFVFSCNQNPDQGSSHKKIVEDNKPKNIETGSLSVDSVNGSENKTPEKCSTCFCPPPFEEAHTQVKIKYGTRHIRFCAWDFYSMSLWLRLAISQSCISKIEVFHPRLRDGLETEKEQQRKQRYYEKKYAEFLLTYAEFKTTELEEIIAEPDSYEDYSVSAASEILKRRKEKN